MKKIVAIALFVLSSFASQAQTADTLREISVGRISLRDSLWHEVVPTTLLTSALQIQSGIDISQALNIAPGVLMQSAGLNNSRITIRGIGARTPFGTNRIRAFYGFIPLTSGDSETTIDDLNLSAISSAEIIRGPMSSAYGAGLGGVILLHPAAASRGTTFGIENTIGEYGLQKRSYRFSHGAKSADVRIDYHTLEQNGWRQNGQYFREGTTLTSELFKTESRRLTLLANLTWMKAYLPSSINHETFESNPQNAAPTWLASKGFEQYKTHLLGAAYEGKLDQNWNFAAAAFANGKDAYEPRPFDIQDNLSLAFGFRGQISGEVKIWRKPVSVLVGSEYFADNSRFDYFENRYQENHGNGSLQGARISGNRQHRNFYNVYARFRSPIAEKTEIQAGVNLNRTQFELDAFLPDEPQRNFSYDAIVSPQLSLIYSPTVNKQFSISAGRGFSLPAVSETLTEQGIPNPDIKPETGWTFEASAKWRTSDKSFSVETNAFHMEISDLLVARRIDNDQYVGVNAGRTQHSGIELMALWHRPIAEKWKLDLLASGSVGRYRFAEFRDGENDFSGNRLTGVPSTKANLIATLWHGQAFLQANGIIVSDMTANDAASETSDGYALLGLKSGWSFSLLRDFTGQLAIGMDNIADTRYASMLAVNALATGGPPRYFYPGSPRLFYFQASFAYRL